MPELYLEIKKAYDNGYFDRAKYLQELANEVITKLVGCKGNLYAVIKEIIKINEGIDLGGVRPPLPNLIEDDLPIVYNCAKIIKEIISSL